MNFRRISKKLPESWWDFVSWKFMHKHCYFIFKEIRKLYYFLFCVEWNYMVS